MKNDDFLEALSRICNDPEFENKLKYNKRVRTKTIGKGIFFSVALIVLIGVVILFGSIYKKHSNPSSSGNNGDVLINTGSDNITPFDDPVLTDAPIFEQTPEPGINNNGSFGEVQIGREILFGQGNSKPTTGHKIGLRFYNFSTDNVISIEAYMNQFISTTPGFFEFNGYPVFEVYEFNPYKYDSETCTSEKINNTNLIINDAKGNFEKRFTVEDLSFLGESDLNLDVFEAGHREALTINFDNYSVGDFVHVAFSYGFFYYKNNPYNASKRDNSWVGKRRFLTFYIGEYGIYISEYRDEDIVIEEYKNITEGLKEFGHNPPEGFLCTAKPLYLRPLSAGVNKVLSGEVFETGFRIVSNKKYDKYMLNLCFLHVVV